MHQRILFTAIRTTKNYGFYDKLRILGKSIFINPTYHSFPEKFYTTSSSAKMGQNFSGDLYIRRNSRDLPMRSLESYTIIGLISSLYAISLNTPVGKKFTDQYTWATVCIGTGIVLSVLRLVIPKEQWYKLATAFVVAGAPMIFRSLYNKTIRQLQRNEASF